MRRDSHAGKSGNYGKEIGHAAAKRAGLPRGSFALRRRGEYRACPPLRAAHAENARFQLSGSLASYRRGAED